MAIETNPEQFLAGEASSSSRKRQRTLTSIAEEEQGVNGGRTTSENRNVDGGDGEVITEVRSGTMFDLDLLECPICCNALAAPIYQCDNGHIACSCCCVKLRNKCPACTLPIGNHRCRIMERVVEAIIVPCPNAKRGCPEKFSYGQELVHEKQCGFALCHCPAPDCNYAGVCKDLYSHYGASHRGTWEHPSRFTCGHASDIWMRFCDGILVLQECGDGPLVAVQCFEEGNGVYVTVNCIAPSAPGVGEFSYRLSCSFGGKTVSFGLEEMNRIQKVSFQTPEVDYMSVPAFFMAQRVSLKMELCIRRLGEEEKGGAEAGEEEEEAAETEEEEEEAAENGEEEEEEEEEEAAETEEEEEGEVDETEVVDKVRRSTRERKVNSKYQDKVK